MAATPEPGPGPRPAPADTPPPIVDDTNVVCLDGRVKRWRNVASRRGVALAAALLVNVAVASDYLMPHMHCPAR